MIVSLDQPIWLLLLIPLCAALWLWPAPTRFLQYWRGGLVGVIVLAMCWPLVKLPSRHGTVIVVVDRSLSMPADAAERQMEQVKLVASSMTPQDRLGIVTFGQSVAVERAPDVGQVQPWVQQVAGDGSNLALAIGRATALLPQDGPSRILILSDGRWTGNDPSAVSAAAASRSVPIDFRYSGRPAANDLAVEIFEAPQSVTPGESFMVSAWIRSPVAQQVNFELLRNQTVIAQGSRQMTAGVSRLIFRDLAGDAGTQAYTLRVTADTQDPVPENNIARALVGVQGASPILVLSQSPGQGLAKLLTQAGLKVTVQRPADVQWSLEFLHGFRGVVFENVPANTMSEADMQTLASWIQQTGSGLMMTGGKQSFGPGGYFKSPLDPILPVSMELRQEHRKFSIALAVALDRSGSMGAPVGGGKTKMDLANLGTAQVVEMLSAMDEIGVLAVDTSPHEIIPMQPVTNPGEIKDKVLRIQSTGGGIYVYQALVAASAMVSKAKPQTRHIILFADAADAEEPGKYTSLLEQCEAAEITVSVIGLGTPKDADAAFLEDVAKRGKGRIYFTEDATELPRLFAQDTFVVARSSFVDEPTPVSITGGMVSIANTNFTDPPPTGGYNLCYIREGANLAAVTRDEYNAPLVAAWQAGAGRVAAYTGEVDGQFTGPIAQWGEFGNMIASLTRWTTGRNLPLPSGMLLRQLVNQGQYRIELHLDPQRAQMDLDKLPVVSLLTGKPGTTPASTRLTMRWVSPDALAIDIPLRSDDTALATIDMGGLGVHNLSPVTLPYSPEFEPARSDQGQPSLERIAHITAGKQRIDLGGIWSELARQPRWEPVAHWVLILAVVLLLMEVFERRSGLMSASVTWALGARTHLKTKMSALQAASEDQKAPVEQGGSWLKRIRVSTPKQTSRQSPGHEPPAAGQGAVIDKPGSGSGPSSSGKPAGNVSPTTPGSLTDAMKQARNKAGRRTTRNE